MHRAGAFKYFLISISSFFLLSILIVSVCLVYNSRTLGVDLDWDETDQKPIVVSRLPWSPLHIGDKILKVGDVTLDYYAWLDDNIYIDTRDELKVWMDRKSRLLDALNRNNTDLTVERAGAVSTIPLEVQRTGLGFAKNPLIFHLLTGVLFFFAGLSSILFQNSNHYKALFYSFCFFSSVMFITFVAPFLTEFGFDIEYYRTFFSINYLTYMLTPATAFHFALIYPRSRYSLFNHKGFYLAYYTIILLIFISGPFWMQNIFGAFFAFGSVVAFFISYAIEKESRLKAELRFFAICFLLGFGPWLLINGIPFVIFQRHIIDYKITSLLIMLLPIGFLFGILKNHLFSENRIISSITLKWIFNVILLITDLIVFLWLATNLTHGVLIDTNRFWSLYYVILMITYLILRDYLKKQISVALKVQAIGEAGSQEGVPVTQNQKIQLTEDTTTILSVREKQIVKYLEQGLQNKEIARKMGISHNTVHTHLKNIYEKLDVKNRQQAVQKARVSGEI